MEFQEITKGELLLCRSIFLFFAFCPRLAPSERRTDCGKETNSKDEGQFGFHQFFLYLSWLHILE